MAKLVMYLLESSAVMALFYLLYILILRKETFFSFNRFFLLGTVLFSLLFPLMRFDGIPINLVAVDRPIEEISRFRMSYHEAMAEWEYENHALTVSEEKQRLEDAPIDARFDWLSITLSVLLIIYATGIIVCISRLIWALKWIFKLLSTHPKFTIDGVKVIQLPDPVAPFSFLTYVFVPQSLTRTADFDQILEHEKTHIRQGHSIDLIFVQLVASFFWFNPVIWRLVKSLKTTHEYIADKKIMDSGYSLVEYQTLLLRQLISNNSWGLVHNFNLSFIKKRITMMNNKKSGWSGKVKVAMTLAGAFFFGSMILQCNAIIDEQDSSEMNSMMKQESSDAMPVPVLPETVFSFDPDLSNTINFAIADDKLTIDGKPYALDEIRAVLEEANYPVDQAIIALSIDKEQQMGFVREVHTELRKANYLKILYIGQTSNGEQVEVNLRLPPHPENEAEIRVLEITDQYAKEHNISLLKVVMGEDEGPTDQQKAYDFVKSQIAQQNSNFVISAKFSDHSSYKDYLISLYHLKEAFYRIYEERAQAMYGKSFQEISGDRNTNEEDKEMYDAVRLEVPMAISIAEG